MPLSGKNVGIGTSTPFAKLTLQGVYGATTPLFDIATTTNSSGSATSSLFRVDYNGNIGIGTSSPSAKLHIGSAASGGNVRIANGWLCVDNNDTCSGGSTAGTVYAVGAYTTGADIAESYPINDPTLVPGEIVALEGTQPTYVTRATSSRLVFGIISTQPGVLLAGYNKDPLMATNTVPVALAGRVPVKVTLAGGAIKMGDTITISSIPGVGMKANASSLVTVGIALEDWAGDPNVLDSAQVGTVLVFVNLSHRELSPVISGETIAIKDNAGADIPFWVVDGTTGNIKYLAEKTIDFGGQALVNIKSLAGVNGKWNLDENGHLVVDGIEVKGTITVGSSERRTGVTLFDKSDGAPYCVAMISGALASTPGACDPNGGNVQTGGSGSGSSSGETNGGSTGDSSGSSNVLPPEGTGSSTPSGSDGGTEGTEDSSDAPSGGGETGSGTGTEGSDTGVSGTETDPPNTGGTGEGGGDTPPPTTEGGDTSVTP
jgi:hypothetical protein